MSPSSKLGKGWKPTSLHCFRENISRHLRAPTRCRIIFDILRSTETPRSLHLTHHETPTCRSCRCCTLALALAPQETLALLSPINLDIQQQGVQISSWLLLTTKLKCVLVLCKNSLFKPTEGKKKCLTSVSNGKQSSPRSAYPPSDMYVALLWGKLLDQLLRMEPGNFKKWHANPELQETD